MNNVKKVGHRYFVVHAPLVFLLVIVSLVSMTLMSCNKSTLIKKDFDESFYAQIKERLDVKVGNRVFKEISLNDEKTSKWMTVESINLYDSNGNTIYIQGGTLVDEMWTEYDDKGNMIHLNSSRP